MNDIKKHIIRLCLKWLLKKGCQSTIPRTGDAVQSVDCYIIYVRNHDDSPYFMPKSVQEGFINGLRWDNQDRSFNIESVMNIEELENYKLEIIHFYQEFEIKYKSFFEWIFNRLPFLSILLEPIKQSAFNKKELARYKRADILRFFVEQYEQDKDKNKKFSSYTVMTDLYSHRWFKHKEGGKFHNYIHLVLESFALSGELKKEGIAYSITGKAVETLDAFEVEERRHKENKFLQLWLVLLTLVIAVSAFIKNSGFYE